VARKWKPSKGPTASRVWNVGESTNPNLFEGVHGNFGVTVVGSLGVSKDAIRNSTNSVKSGQGVDFDCGIYLIARLKLNPWVPLDAGNGLVQSNWLQLGLNS